MLDIAAGCGLDRAWAEARLDDTALNQRLIDTTNAAADAGVFGVPTFALDGHLFGATIASRICWQQRGETVASLQKKHPPALRGR